MQLFTYLEGFSNEVVKFLAEIQSIFFGTVDDAVQALIYIFYRNDPFIDLSYIYEQMKQLNGIVENSLGVDILFFLDIPVDSFLLPSVITILVIILAIIGIWRLILSLIPFV